MDSNAEDDQKENVSSENLSPPNGHTPVPSFSELTASHFGISVQSFAPSASPKGERSAAFMIQDDGQGSLDSQYTL